MNSMPFSCWIFRLDLITWCNRYAREKASSIDIKIYWLVFLCVLKISFFWAYKSYVSSGVLTSWSTSWAAIAFSTFFLDVSCISPPINNSSSMKYAFSKLKMMSSSHTCSAKKKHTNLLINANRKCGSLQSKIRYGFWYSHCQSIYPIAQHNDEWFQVLAIRYHSARLHSRNINSHIWKQI